MGIVRTRGVSCFGLALAMLGAAPAAAQWGTYTAYSYSAEFDVVAEVEPSQATAGSVVAINTAAAADGVYEVLFSSANSAHTAVVFGTGNGGQIEVVVPNLPPGPVGVEVTAQADGSLLLSTAETALEIVAAPKRPWKYDAPAEY